MDGVSAAICSSYFICDPETSKMYSIDLHYNMFPMNINLYELGVILDQTAVLWEHSSRNSYFIHD